MIYPLSTGFILCIGFKEENKIIGNITIKIKQKINNHPM